MDTITSSSDSYCKSCERLLPPPAGGGHRQREYCDDACRQAARRARLEETRREQCVEQVRSWGTFQPATVDYLACLLLLGNKAGARRLAALIADEQGQAPAQSETIEKLRQLGERTTKLEKQVETQRQLIGQYHARFYPSSLAVAVQKLMALGAAINYKILLKYDAQAVEVLSGEAAWKEFASHASYEDVAQAILQAQYLFDNLYALGMVGKRDN
jgi:hypothetical protein